MLRGLRRKTHWKKSTTASLEISSDVLADERDTLTFMTPSQPEPVATKFERNAVRKWLARGDRAAAWHSFAELARDERWRHRVDIPDPDDQRFEALQARVFPSRGVVFLCEKFSVQQSIDNWLGDALAAVGTVHVSPWVSAWTTDMIQRARRSSKARLVFLGDLDPDALFQFGCLRAGGRDALLRGEGPTFDVSWGVHAAVVRVVRDRAVDLRRRMIQLPWLERRYWKLVKKVVPDARKLLGKQTFAMLNDGMKLELDALCHDDAYSMLPGLNDRYDLSLAPVKR